MKRKLSQTVLVAAAGCLLLTGSAMAATVTYIDIYKEFPGHATSFAAVDQINNPAVGDMTVTFDDENRQLLSVSLMVTNRLVWDTLFINTSYNLASDLEKWDYIVWDKNGLATGTSTPPNYYPTNAVTGLYAVKNEASYTYTTATSTGRNGHPNGIAYADLNLVTTLTTGGFGKNISYFQQAAPITGRIPDTLTYDFANQQIFLGQNFAIAYAPWCANDVTMTPNAVPEPAAALLLSAGLFCLIGLNQRQSSKA